MRCTRKLNRRAVCGGNNVNGYCQRCAEAGRKTATGHVPAPRQPAGTRKSAKAVLRTRIQQRDAKAYMLRLLVA